MSHTFKCPHCTAPLTIDDGGTLAVKCDYCGMSSPVPQALRPQTSGRTAVLSDALVAQVAAQIAAGRKAEAIAAIRRATGMAAADAERVYEAMRSGDAATLTGFLQTTSPQIVVKRGSCLGTVIMWVVIFIIGASIFFWQAGGDALRILGGVMPAAVGRQVEQVAEAVVPPFAGLAFQNNAVFANVDGPQPDLVAIALETSASRTVLAYVDTMSRTVRWRSEADAQSTFAVTDDRVYLATKSRLRAIDRRSGATRWETTLSDVIGSACNDCLLVSGERVFVLSNDATVQAFDVSDGRKVWSQTLSTISPRIALWKERVVVIDRDEDHKPYASGRMRIFDAAGDADVTLHPSCETPNTRNSAGGQEYADADSAISIDPASDSLYAWFGGFSSCVQKYSLTDGTLVWTAQVDARAEDGRGAQFFHQSGRLLIVGDESVLTADPATGKTAVLYRVDKDYDGLYAFGVEGDTLLARTSTTRGTRRDVLLAIDLATGAIRWTTQFDDDGGAFTAAQSYSGLLSNSQEETAWTAHLGASAVHLVRIASKPFRYIFETLDAKSGVSTGRVEAPLEGNPLLLGPALIGWRGDVAWVHLDGSFVALDAAAKKPVAKVGQ